jgi:predicted anti-sigma-YlaC factor YlaD
MTPRVRAHVEQCDECRAAWQRLDAMVRLLDTTPGPAVPGDLRHRVMAAIDSRSARRSKPAWAARPVLAAAAAMAVVGLLAVEQLAVGPGHDVMVAGSDDLRPATYLQQHAMVAAADPLADAAMGHALGTLALRTELGVHSAADEL